VAWSREIPHVLQDQERWILCVNDPHDVEEQGAAGGVHHAQLVAALREGLTRETRAKHVVVRDQFVDLGARPIAAIGVLSNRPDIAMNAVSDVWPRGLIDALACWIDIAGEHALTTEGGQGVMKAADAGEEVDETKARRAGHTHSLPSA
jgi:hypothetical protein